jgi:hypothetical protein
MPTAHLDWIIGILLDSNRYLGGPPLTAVSEYQVDSSGKRQMGREF